MLKKEHDIELLICRMFSALILLLLLFPENVFGTGMFHLLTRPLHWPETHGQVLYFAAVFLNLSEILVVSTFKKVSLTPDHSP